MAKKFIKNAIKHPGALHSHLGIPPNEKIPAEKLEAARHSKNPTIRREAALAHTLAGLPHGGKKHHSMTTKNIHHSLYKS